MFVWTLNDLIGAIFLGMFALVGLLAGAVYLYETMLAKFKRWMK